MSEHVNGHVHGSANGHGEGDAVAATIARAQTLVARFAATAPPPQRTAAAPLPAFPPGITAADLQAATFPPLRWTVSDVLPEGTALLVGPPKGGKSRLALSLALAVASGGVALSYCEVATSAVLLLALEDSPRRLRRRIAAQMPPGTRWPAGLDIRTSWPRLHEGGAELLDAYLAARPACRFVVLDILQMIRAPTTSRENSYAAEYDAARALKAVADRHGVTLLIVHHTRKMDATDPLALASGTHGLTGAVDSVLVLQRDPQGGASLYLRGRDVEEQTHALRYDSRSGTWAITTERPMLALPESRRAVLDLLAQRWPYPVTAPQIAAALRVSDGAIRQRLLALTRAELIRRVGRGLYTLPQHPAGALYAAPVIDPAAMSSDPDDEDPDDPDGGHTPRDANNANNANNGPEAPDLGRDDAPAETVVSSLVSPIVSTPEDEAASESPRGCADFGPAEPVVSVVSIVSTSRSKPEVPPPHDPTDDGQAAAEPANNRANKHPSGANKRAAPGAHDAFTSGEDPDVGLAAPPLDDVHASLRDASRGDRRALEETGEQLTRLGQELGRQPVPKPPLGPPGCPTPGQCQRRGGCETFQRSGRCGFAVAGDVVTPGEGVGRTEELVAPWEVA